MQILKSIFRVILLKYFLSKLSAHLIKFETVGLEELFRKNFLEISCLQSLLNSN